MVAEKKLTMLNRAGMHLRPASKIVSALRDLQCEVEISFDSRTANAKSIISLTQLLAPQNSVLLVKAQGPDARRAIAALEKLFREKFGED